MYNLARAVSVESTDATGGRGQDASRARPVVFEFARPARDEHHAPRVEHHEYKLKNEHELEHSAAADRDMNSRSARPPTLSKWRRRQKHQRTRAGGGLGWTCVRCRGLESAI